MSKLGDKLGDLWKGFKSRLTDIRGGILKLNAQERHIETRPKDGLEMQEKHLDIEIDGGAREGESELLSLQHILDPTKADSLVFPRTYNPNQDITMLINRFHFFCAALEKEKIKKLFADKWPKDAITTEEREKRLKEIRAARAALEKEEEQTILELAPQGVRVNRRPDQTPEIFLNWGRQGLRSSEVK